MPRGRKVVLASGTPEQMAVYADYVLNARRKNIAKARKVRMQRIKERESWTQEQWNEWWERNHGWQSVRSELDVPVGTKLKKNGKPYKRQPPELEEDLPKPERPDYPKKPRSDLSELAATLASLQWTDRKREEQRRKMRGNKRAVGHFPWNKGKTKKDDPRLQHVADVAMWMVQVKSKS